MGVKVTVYSPSSETDHSMGSSRTSPVGVVTRALTSAPFTSTNPASSTSAFRVTGSPTSTEARSGAASTASGVSATTERSNCRQKVSWLWSSSGTLASICQSQESCMPSTIARPLP